MEGTHDDLQQLDMSAAADELRRLGLIQPEIDALELSARLATIRQLRQHLKRAREVADASEAAAADGGDEEGLSKELQAALKEDGGCARGGSRQGES